MADPYVGAARTVLGQGLALGWGDEAEAWLQSKIGTGSYEQNLAKIRGEIGDYHKQNPVLAPVGEFVGGALPGLAAFALPGGQPAGAAQLARAATPVTSGLLKSAGLGALTGAISGAGSADQDRVSGALSGGLLGGAVGAALPLAMRGASASAKWLMERLHPTESGAKASAARSINNQLARSGVEPAELASQMASDKAVGVPSMLLNSTPRLEKVARTVVKRAGSGADELEKALVDQRLGSRERVHQQTVKGLKSGDYYDDLEHLNTQMRSLSDPLYQKAYQFGEVTDPAVLSYLTRPQFRQGMREAAESAAIKGERIDFKTPTVETLDKVKRGVDKLIEREVNPITGKLTSRGAELVAEKNKFLTELDRVVPDYELARGVWSGGSELTGAMRKGLNEFASMDHEQVIKAVKDMSQSELEAFRTGVARDLYSKIMNPGSNINAAQRIVGSPEMQQKLRPLFNSSNEFDLFKNALDRESQLYHTAGRILGGSDTAENQQLIKQFEGENGVGEFIERATTGGFRASLANIALKALGKSEMGDMKAGKLSEMLMSKDPHEVAAVVKLLETQAAADAPKAFRATTVERGAVTGLNAMVPTAPSSPIDEGTLEDALILDNLHPSADQNSGKSALQLAIEAEDASKR